MGSVESVASVPHPKMGWGTQAGEVTVMALDVRRFKLMLLALVSCLTPAVGVAAGAEEPGEAIVSAMNALRDGGALPMATKALASGDAGAVLAAVAPFADDDDRKVRRLANALAWHVANGDVEPRIRRQVATQLVTACSDPESLVWQHAARQLLDFDASDFTLDAKERIRTLVRGRPRREFVRLTGVAGLRGLLPRLAELAAGPTNLDTGKWYGKVNWAAQLARARLGNEFAVRRCIVQVQAETDEVVRVTLLLQDVAYIRHPQATRVIGHYLDSDRELPVACHGEKGMAFAQYALDVLTRSVGDFPVQPRFPGAYSTEEIEQARAWMGERY